jgi:carbon-monoxide dehydrogenase large subunit
VRHLGVKHIDLPCTPERVWAAVRQAQAGTLAEPWREPPAVFDRLEELGGQGGVAEDAAI